MKRFTFLFLGLFALAFLPTQMIAQTNCTPAAAVTVSGTADINVNTSHSFTGVATGTVIELIATGAGDEFSVDLCSTNADGWADGTNDSSLNILDMNAAGATVLGNIEDGCANGAGPNFWGPDTGSWAAPAAGTYYLYLTEWNAAGTDGCIADGANSSYAIDITIAPNPLTCADINLGTYTATGTSYDAGTNTLCVIENDPIQITLNDDVVVPNASPEQGFTWYVTSAPVTMPNDPPSDPAWLGAFGFQASQYNVGFSNDGASGLTGGNTYYLTPFIFGNATADVDGNLTFDPACSFSGTTLILDLKATGETCSTPVEDVRQITNLDISPNPSNGVFSMNMSFDASYEVSVEIFDVAGKSLTTRSVNGSSALLNFDLSNQANGVYFAKIGVEGNFTTEKIIINK